MSEKKFEPCSLEEATHVELGGKVHKLGDGIVHKRICFGSCHGITVCYNEWRDQNSIYKGVFPVLGIKPIREKKREPIEFEFIMSLNNLSFFPPLNVPMEAVGKKFKCVQILEEEE